MALFDRIVAVDWSAASRPVTGINSIWVAVAEGGAVGTPLNPATRHAAVAVIAESCFGRGRTLIVVDWSLGYPSGSAVAFGLARPAEPHWRSLHRFLIESIIDEPNNRNNRFAVAADLNRRAGGPGPFWGATARAATHQLTTTKQEFGVVREWRETECRLRSNRRWPSSCWQLTGSGAVGSQSLLGIPRLHELRRRVATERRLAIWPLETGISRPDDEIDVVVAEMWPSLLNRGRSSPAHPVRDAAQVVLAAEWFAAADASGRLVEQFAPTVEDPDAVIGEEGWILGLD